jgi:hypothetical protein
MAGDPTEVPTHAYSLLDVERDGASQNRNR